MQLSNRRQSETDVSTISVKPSFVETRPSSYDVKCFNSIAQRVLFANSGESEESNTRAQRDFERMLVRRHKDGPMPENYTDFLREFTNDESFIKTMASASPQAIGNDLLFVLLSDFNLSEHNAQKSDYDDKICIPAITSNNFSPTNSLVQTMFTKDDGDNIRMISMITSFAMMHQTKEGDVSMITVRYDPESKTYDYFDVLQSSETLNALSDFYTQVRTEMNATGKRFVTFKDITNYCNAIPEDQPKFLPITSAMVELKYIKEYKKVSVQSLNVFYPQAEGLMRAYNPVLSRSKTMRGMGEKNRDRAFYFNRLGDEKLPEPMSETKRRVITTTALSSYQKTHEQYGDDCQIKSDCAIYKHEQKMNYVERFVLSLLCAIDAYRIKAQPRALKAK